MVYMACAGSDEDLLRGVYEGDFNAVKAALEAGASVNGSKEQPCAPIVAATMANHVGMLVFLLEEGVDPDTPVTADVPCPTQDAAPGERALHIAARRGQVEIVRLLLNRARADPNATDNIGRTPLIAMCRRQHVSVEAARLLLEAGADPALAEQKDDYIPLHYAAVNGHIDLVDMFYSAAPATLNQCDSDGKTPLFFACAEGHEAVVSKLLSLGANQRPRHQRAPHDEIGMCPLMVAVGGGQVGVVRVLINEGGIRAIGGGVVMPKALFVAVCCRQPRILRLLLTVDGERRRSEWANLVNGFCGRPLLDYGASYCYPATVGVLLEAGADETTRDSRGRSIRDSIGVGVSGDRIDRGEEATIRRMLERGPAYRARSWAWPSDKEADACGHGADGDIVAADAADAAGAGVLLPPPTAKPSPVAGLRIFRPKEKSSNIKFFVRLVARYCVKD